MNILLLNTYDKGGGAEKVASDLLRAYRAAGHDARMFVRYKRGADDNVFPLDAYQNTNFWSRPLAGMDKQISARDSFRGKFRLIDWLRRSAFPQRWRDRLRGIEDFNYPASRALLAGDWKPDVVHAHNLHGDYFDLRAFEQLGKHIPIVWTLHDTWAFTGHCGHFLDCNRWLSGCGHCPDLKRPPAVRADGTAENYQTKKRIYQRSNFSVATPSQWLMSQVAESILQEKERRVIPNGVDLEIFKSGAKLSARRALNLPEAAFICIYVSYYGAQTNPYKDYTTIARAIELLTAENPDIFFVCIGGATESARQPHSLETGFVDDPRVMALYYQAADVLLHAAHAENFPTVILEAMACATVPLATAVGGIPEQVRDGETGFSVPRRDASGLAQRVILLKQNPALRERISAQACVAAQKHYSLDAQVTRYLDWFHNLVKSHQHAKL